MKFGETMIFRKTIQNNTDKIWRKTIHMKFDCNYSVPTLD